MKCPRILSAVAILLTMFIIGGDVMAHSVPDASDVNTPQSVKVESIVLLSPGMDNPRVQDVEEQFNNLAIHGDALGARQGEAEDACECVHYQSIARGQDVDGVPYMFLTRSGNDSEACTDVPGGELCWPSRCSAQCTSFMWDKKPGELVVAQLSSRNKDGERMRSNRLEKGKQMKDTAPPEEDIGVASYLFNGQDGWPKYMHPGGMQLVGDVLLVALEKHCDGTFTGVDIDGSDTNCTDEGAGKGAVALIDVSSPVNATLLHVEELWPSGDDSGVYLVAATRIAADEHPHIAEDRYLFVWTHNDKTYSFGWSDTDDLHTTMDISHAYTWEKDDLDQDKWMSWQTLNFVRDINGDLYLIGMGSTSALANEGSDWARLFKVDLNKLTTDDIDEAIIYVAERHLKLQYGGLNLGDFGAAGGTYVSPSGQLMLYSGAYENSGPGGSLQMGEFRNVNILYDGLLSDACSGWVELYDEDNGWLKFKDGYDNRSIMFDYVDLGKDDWDDLDHYDAGFDDNATSVKWNLPPGQTATLCKKTQADGCGETIELGSQGYVLDNKEYYPTPDVGSVLSIADFKDLDGGWNDQIGSVEMTAPTGFGPDVAEICDGIDNNCDGEKDEGFGGDSDADGWGANCDNCPDHSNRDQADDDQDTRGDACDNCPAAANTGQEDSDDDGDGDACDTCTDTDNDDYGNPGYSANTCLDDNCPDIFNPNQVDTDDDGAGDVCDTCTDTDNDDYGNPGYSANTCPDDNCPDIFNPNQADRDGDGVGDVCDNCVRVYNPDQADEDGDGIGSACEPSNLKQWVIEYLSDLQLEVPPDDKKTSKSIEKAIEHVEKSLDDRYWLDDSHLDEKGNKVFDEEKNAVKELMKIIKDGDSPAIDSAWRAIESLILADQTLVQVALEDAQMALQTCSDKDCNKALKEIEKTQEEMAKAQEDLDKGDPDRAIDHYKKAWEHAQKALDRLS